jgi:hypothetical protein
LVLKNDTSNGRLSEGTADAINQCIAMVLNLSRFHLIGFPFISSLI